MGLGLLNGAIVIMESWASLLAVRHNIRSGSLGSNLSIVKTPIPSVLLLPILATLDEIFLSLSYLCCCAESSA